MKRMFLLLLKVCLTLLMLSMVSGCYYYNAASGHLAIMNGQRPIADAIADEQDPKRLEMLEVVAEVRTYGTNVMQLRPGDNYTSYYATEAKGLTYVVVACDPTSFEPRTWWFPIVGTMAYKSHFDEEDAESEAQKLRDEGYDVWIGRSTAYSTLGWFRDPVITTMMQGNLVDFIETLFHEMAHGRLYVNGHTDFNEQMASFVGRVGLVRFLSRPPYKDSGLLQEYHDGVAYRKVYKERMNVAVEALDVLYASGKSKEVILVERQVIFDDLSNEMAEAARARGVEPDPERLVVNNARLMQFRRYSEDSDYLQEMWDKSGHSWVVFWKLLEGYAETLE